MSTRSWIAKQNDDGSYKTIYCHSDGYYSYVGKILYENYTDPKKIDEMLSFGDMSSIGKEVGEKHDFNDYKNDWCRFYNRDRGEEGVDARNYNTFYEMKKAATESWAEYLYIYQEGQWFACKLSVYSESESLQPLAIRLKKEKE